MLIYIIIYNVYSIVSSNSTYHMFYYTQISPYIPHGFQSPMCVCIYIYICTLHMYIYTYIHFSHILPWLPQSLHPPVVQQVFQLLMKAELHLPLFFQQSQHRCLGPITREFVEKIWLQWGDMKQCSLKFQVSLKFSNLLDLAYLSFFRIGFGGHGRTLSIGLWKTPGRKHCVQACSTTVRFETRDATTLLL